METLPQEVVDQIASYLCRSDLKSLLLLSPKLKIAAERHSDGFTRCKLYYKTLERFVEKFRGPRFCWLRKLEYDLRLPEHLAHDDVKPTEGSIAAKTSDEYISYQIRALFNALKTLEDIDRPQGTIHLKITSPERIGAGSTNPTTTWQVNLPHLEQLPVLHSIGFLYVGPSAYQQASTFFGKFALRTPLDLSAKLPNLGMLQVDLIDEHHCDVESERIRFEAREDFARVAQTMSLQAKRAEIIFQRRRAHENLDHNSRMPNLVRAGPADPFSSNLRNLCRHLTQLQLTAIIDGSFFWPDDAGGDIWPNMESLEVKFHPVTPTGSWYFMGPREEGRGVQGYPVDGIKYSLNSQTTSGGDITLGHSPCRPSGWRLKPNPDTLYPFLAAFAKAAAKMPRLKEAMLWSPIWWSPGNHSKPQFSYNTSFDMVYNQRPLGWGIGYNAPGAERDLDGSDRSEVEDSDEEHVRLFEWRTGSWEPDEAMKDLFHEIGREQHGDEFDDDWDPDAIQEDLFFEGFCFGKTLN